MYDRPIGSQYYLPEGSGGKIHVQLTYTHSILYTCQKKNREKQQFKYVGGYQGRKGLYQYSWIFSILPRKAKEWQRRSQTPRASSEQSG